MEDYEIALKKWAWGNLSNIERTYLRVNHWREIEVKEVDAHTERDWDTFGSNVYDVPAEIHIYGQNSLSSVPYTMTRPGLAQMIFELLRIEITEEDRSE